MYILVYMFLLKVVHSLNFQNVDYALVGGYAVALHGAVRGTLDIDIVISLSQSSYLRAETALQSIGLQSRLPVSATDVFMFRKEFIENRNLIAWSFYDPKNPAYQLDIIITEDLKKIKKVKKEIHGVLIKVVSIEALIEMKTRSGRPQDLEDIRALKALVDKS